MSRESFPRLMESSLDEEVSGAARKLISAFQGLIFRHSPTLVDWDNKTNSLRVDVRPCFPCQQAKAFLLSIEEMAIALKLTMASRKYRLTFTKNYRYLLPPDKRAYRVDVLEAAQDGQTTLWVNGESYRLGLPVIALKESFRSSWYSLLALLHTLLSEFDHHRLACIACSICSKNNGKLDNVKDGFICEFCTINWLEKLGLSLINFDIRWSYFEREYIGELIQIESASRRLLMNCILAEEELQYYEVHHASLINQDTQIVEDGRYDKNLNDRLINEGNSGLSKTKRLTELKELSLRNITRPFTWTHLESDALVLTEQHIKLAYESLIQNIAVLNATANTKGKGRGDLTFKIFEVAFAIILRNEPWKTRTYLSPHEKRFASNLDCLFPLALPLIDSLLNFRRCLREIGSIPETIDPHLAQNRCVVAQLARIESSWDMAKHHLESEAAGSRLVDFIQFMSKIINYDFNLRKGKQSSRETAFLEGNDRKQESNVSGCLEECIASCDVTAFLTIPRLVVLYFLLNPLADSKSSCLMHFLLPAQFSGYTSQDRTGPSFINESNTWPSGEQVFRLFQLLMKTRSFNKLPENFISLITQLERVGSLCTRLKQPSQQSFSYLNDVWEAIFEWFVLCDTEALQFRFTNSPRLQPLLEGICLMAEECSMLIQRTNSMEWNEFLMVIVNCLEHLRGSRSATVDADLLKCSDKYIEHDQISIWNKEPSSQNYLTTQLIG